MLDIENQKGGCRDFRKRAVQSKPKGLERANWVQEIEVLYYQSVICEL